MKIKNKKRIFFTFIILVIGMVFIPNASPNQYFNINKFECSRSGNHSPIVIDGNDEFTPENGVTDGNGTEEDPYIIENWVIEGHGSNLEGIYILNADVYFIIRNCTAIDFYGVSSGLFGSGIRFSSVKNGRIENTTTCRNFYGIQVDKNSSYIEIDNCSSMNSSTEWASGIRCDNSQYITIKSSVSHDNYDGVFFTVSSYVHIENSSFHNNDYCGILGITDCKDFVFNYTIKNCQVYNNGNQGISIHNMLDNPFRRQSGHIQISHCEIYDNGIPEPQHWGTEGIFIGGLHDNIIENCDIYHNGHGIGLVSCTNNIIRNCSIFNHFHPEGGTIAMGIEIARSGFTFGYKMKGSHNEITNCDIFNNGIGLELFKSNTLIQKNNIFNNIVRAIDGFQFVKSKIKYNNIFGNNDSHEMFIGSVVLTIFCYNDLRNNWWGSSSGPKIGRCKDIFTFLSIARFWPWEKEPIPDAGVQ